MFFTFTAISPVVPSDCQPYTKARGVNSRDTTLYFVPPWGNASTSVNRNSGLGRPQLPEFSENPLWAAIRKMGVSWCEVWPQITAWALIQNVKPGRWASNWNVYISTTCIFEPFSWLYQSDRGSRTFTRYLLVHKITMGVKLSGVLTQATNIPWPEITPVQPCTG